MPGTLFVGLDVGTTTSKAVVFTQDGDPVASGRATTPWTVTVSGAELDATALLDAAKSAVAQALADAPPGPVGGLGVASIAESGVLLDRHGESVAPVIAWHDTRDHAELDSLREAVGAQNFSATTGLPLRQQWSLTKHRWLIDNIPSAGSAVRRLNVAEWIVRGLGGEEATEQSLASRTGWLRLADRSWWADTLAWSGAGESLMPPLVTAGTPLGRVGADAGLPRLAGAVLTVAGHDHQAAVVGAGADGPGDELDSCGTAEALVRTVAPGLSPMSSQASPMRASPRGGTPSPTTGVCSAPPRVGSLCNASSRCSARTGPTCPHWTPTRSLADARRRYLRPDLADSPAHRWRAALEEVTEQAADIHDAMSAVAGPHRKLVVTGGWSRSAGFLAVKRRRFGDLTQTDVSEAGARGAAMFAAKAAAAMS